MQWGPELRGIDHATAPSISVLSRAIPDRQSVYGARNKSCTRLHDSAWQCMMDGVVHSWHFIAGKLVTITQAPGNSFNMQQTSISIENIIYLSCLHVQHLSFLFSLSLHSDWHRGPNTQTNQHNPAAFTNNMQYAVCTHCPHKYIRSFTPCTKA